MTHRPPTAPWRPTTLGLVVAVLIAIGVGASMFSIAPAELPYYTEISPDARFEIHVISDGGTFAIPWFSTPGQGGASESPGVVVLRDRLGHELERVAVEMKQSVPGGVIWLPDRVSIVATGTTWSLPTVTPGGGE